MTTSEIISLVSLLFAIVAAISGGVFALIQWEKSIKIRRSEFVESIINKLRFDPEISKALYKIDYGEHWYTADFHNGSENEIIMDKMFTYLSYICYLRKTRCISKQEFAMMEYDIVRLCYDKDTTKYFNFLKKFSAENDTTFSYTYLDEYIQKKLL